MLVKDGKGQLQELIGILFDLCRHGALDGWPGDLRRRPPWPDGPRQIVCRAGVPGNATDLGVADVVPALPQFH